MAIPKFEDFLYPFLAQLKDKDVSTKEMKDAMVKHFNLTEEDCSLKTKSGSAFQLAVSGFVVHSSLRFLREVYIALLNEARTT